MKKLGPKAKLSAEYSNYFKSILIFPGISGLKSNSTILTAKTCTQESDYVYSYNDITLPVTLNSPAQCCTRCGQTPGCVAWSYLVSVQYCYLKNALPSNQNRVPYQNSYSGVVINVVIS